MSKVLLVALPLLALAAWALLRAWRRRPPTKRTLNVVASLLLAVYVLTTAGLGVFWVANQQLPVFDWHYLFGYATVLLVLVHLAFNLPTAWRHLMHRRAVPEPAPPAHRRLAAAAAMLLALGAAFWLGLRQGRSELRLDLAADGADHHEDAALVSLRLVERFHAHTSHTRGGVLLRAAGGWQEPPPRFRREPERPRIALPSPLEPAMGPSVAALGCALWHTAGVTSTRGGVPLRASPSSGALFSTELYVAAWRVTGLPPGLWHHDALDHALERLADTAPDAVALGLPDDTGTVAAIVATAVFGRTGHKYRDRCYRYVLADLGHALENLLVSLAALGLRPRPLARFDEVPLAAALGLDESVEGVLAVVMVDTDTGRPASSATVAALPPTLAVLKTTTPAELTVAMHRLSSLRAATAPLPRPAPLPPPADVVHPLPPAALPPHDVLAAIAARRSVRRFAARPLPLAALAALLDALALGRPLLSPALRLDLVVHGVTRLAPGAYRWAPERRRLHAGTAPARPRAASRAAALEQDVVGDAAVLLLLSMDRALAAADADGPARGYRHALLEAGLVGERAYLACEALGLGACSVGAFYDDEAAALVGVDPRQAWVLHLVAIGTPG